MDKPEHYRYTDVLNEGGLHIVEQTFRVLRATTYGYWIQPTHGSAPDLSEDDIDFRIRKASRPFNVRWVSLDSSRRYCYPTRAEAMHSYHRRKEAQIRHAETALAKARLGLKVSGEILSVGSSYPVCKHTGSILAGMPPEFAGVQWHD